MKKYIFLFLILLANNTVFAPYKVASGSFDNTVKIWNVKTGKEDKTLKGHTEEVASVVFKPEIKKRWEKQDLQERIRYLRDELNKILQEKVSCKRG